jgi:ADP-ribosylation factor GTPase-activating protein 1
VASGVQKGTKGAAEQFNRFVEGAGDNRASASRTNLEPEKKDFWDSFGGAGSTAGERAPLAGSTPKKSSTIGTSAVKGSSSDKQDWDNDNWDKF